MITGITTTTTVIIVIIVITATIATIAAGTAGTADMEGTAAAGSTITQGTSKAARARTRAIAA